ncbi:hypothetical protein SY83_03415 [Paenibacillus swuensis]|uniref:HAMP domain-containing protein n=1 Tax=Paenibacillus swuensis TaxID=1178515 RepID=A0A172TEP5_9BACL|nr:sensor histidine kinase [Paenibacillus swuensis]ANE45519.1 hypothetical protein SY83_03415 [Paenibacillus swuensis]
MRWIHGISFKLFTLCFAILLCSILLISLVSYQFMRGEMVKHERVYTEQILLKVEQYLDLYSAMAGNLLSSVETLVGVELNEHLQSQVDDLYDSSLEYINNIYLIERDLTVTGGNIYSKVFSEAVPNRQVLYQETVEAWPETIISEPYVSPYSGWTVTISRSIRQGKDYVVVAVDLNIGSLVNRMLELSGTEDIRLGLLSAEGNVIAWPAQAGSGSSRVAPPELKVGTLTARDIINEPYQQLTVRTEQMTRMYIDKRYLPRLNWVAFSVLQGSRVENALNLLEHYLVYFIAFGFMVSLAAAWLIARFIRKPLNRLMRVMRQMKADQHLNVVIRDDRKDEFGELASEFSDMIRKIRHLIDNLNASEKLKRDLEFQVLQSQINPHFLYNTLGSISNVVELGRTEQVDPIIGALISILEYGVADASDQVTLRDELWNVEHYLLIQNIRYDGHFEFVTKVDQELWDWPVLRLMLQPIVENSIFHGYRGSSRMGPIRISAWREAEAVLISVEDHGVGMTEEQVEALLAPDRYSTVPHRRKRIGLYNIHKRIQLHCGNELSGLEVRSAVGEGTTVTIRWVME